MLSTTTDMAFLVASVAKSTVSPIDTTVATLSQKAKKIYMPYFFIELYSSRGSCPLFKTWS